LSILYPGSVYLIFWRLYSRIGGGEQPCQECALNRTIETERLILRPIEVGDWPAIYRYASLAEVVRYLPHEPFTEEDASAFALRWSEQARQLELAGSQHGDEWPEMLVVEHRADGRIIGHIPFEQFSPKYRTREIGWVFDPRYQGQGYATEAAWAVLDLAFGQLGLHRVVATCDPRNTASYRVMEKLGMRREGHHWKDVQIRGEWSDEYFYAILEEEWKG
jgi:RimJ/RimL family protein N-acetyltransferase